MKKELQRLTLKVRNEAPEEESLAKIRALRRELKTLDDEFRQFTAATPTSKPRVRGFKFPINNEHELERLESTVITNRQIRNQYVSNLGLGEWIFFSMLNSFTDRIPGYHQTGTPERAANVQQVLHRSVYDKLQLARPGEGILPANPEKTHAKVRNLQQLHDR